LEALEIIYKILHEYGFLTLISLAEAAIIYYLFILLKQEQKERKELMDRLLSFSEKRLEDIKEERDNYEELARNMDNHMELLIKVFRRKNGNGNGD